MNLENALRRTPTQLNDLVEETIVWMQSQIDLIQETIHSADKDIVILAHHDDGRFPIIPESEELEKEVTQWIRHLNHFFRDQEEAVFCSHHMYADNLRDENYKSIMTVAQRVHFIAHQLIDNLSWVFTEDEDANDEFVEICATYTSILVVRHYFKLKNMTPELVQWLLIPYYHLKLTLKERRINMDMSEFHSTYFKPAVRLFVHIVNKDTA